TIVNGISRIGYMTGGGNALWVDEDMADVFVTRAKKFLRDHAKRPFCLYFATHDIHVPRVPNRRFVGKTAMGPRGDAIVQLDWCVGELLDELDALHLAENTLVIFTSDNGPVVNDGYRDQSEEKLGEHRPAGPWRGGKYSAFEGGTRVPFVVRWPGRVAPGESAALVGQVDFCATLAKIAGVELADGDAPDSLDQSAAWFGKDRRGRDHLIEQAGALSLRQGAFKFIEANKRGAFDKQTKTELGN
ncbi:MAG: sulfatase-like hydrolase/transferase, partial [Planctomycetes bacterium]|nr:sulfatase-like hydrolase/transferase [Planctomycetota bacterium]